VVQVAMSGVEDPDRVTEVLMAGAVSWVPKRVDVLTLATVVLGSARGESSVPPGLLRQVLHRLTAGAVRTGRQDTFAGLTDREREILEYAALGLSRGEIAEELALSINTVRTHLQHVLSKLGVHTTLEAATLLLRERTAADDASGVRGGPGRGPQ
jgi:DNA-binding NarL/FixJ family response regulator